MTLNEFKAWFEGFTDGMADAPCMSAMTEWAVQHPKWRVVRWRCGVREEAI